MKNWTSYLSPKKIRTLNIFLEYRKTRKYVGHLTSKLNRKNENIFVFTYDKKYLYSKSSLPLGPELPLTKELYKSKELFKTFKDRIPSRGNPAYKDYCENAGVDKSEKNPIILLATIGKKGPSSFAFEPVYEELIDNTQVMEFRKNLGLTIREFSAVFDFSTKTVQKIEAGESIARDTKKHIETLILFPQVALYEIHKNGGMLNFEKRMSLLSKFENNS